MSNERIDLEWLLEEDGLMQDLNWSIARFEQVEKLVKEMTAELKRCYEKIDWLQQVADLAADNIGRKNWNVFEEAMYEAGLWERPSE